MADVDYGYGDSPAEAQDYGYEGAAPATDTAAPVPAESTDYGYGDDAPAAANADYGYGDDAPAADYGYGAPDTSDYGYGDTPAGTDYGYADEPVAAPAPAPMRTAEEEARRPKRRGSVTRFSIEAEACDRPLDYKWEGQKEEGFDANGAPLPPSAMPTVPEPQPAAPADNADYGYGDDSTPAPAANTDYGYGDAPAANTDYGYGDDAPAAEPAADYGYGDDAPVASNADYGYGDDAPAAANADYGYGDDAPAADYGYGAPDTAEYGYGDTPAGADYGYGDAPAADADYGYGDEPAAPAPAPVRTAEEESRRPKRRGSVTRFSIEAEACDRPLDYNWEGQKEEGLDANGAPLPPSAQPPLSAPEPQAAPPVDYTNNGYGEGAPHNTNDYGYGDNTNNTADYGYGTADTSDYAYDDNAASHHGAGPTHVGRAPADEPEEDDMLAKVRMLSVGGMKKKVKGGMKKIRKRLSIV